MKTHDTNKIPSVPFDDSIIKHFSENERSMNLLVKNVKKYAIFITNISGFIVSWNKGAEYITGYTPDEIIGKHISEFDQSDHAKELISHECEGWLVRKNGSGFWANITAAAIEDGNSALTGFSVIIHDLTKEKLLEEQLLNINKQLGEKEKEHDIAILESEKKYSHLFDNNPMPMWVIDLATFKFLDVNEAAIFHYGYTRELFLSMTAIDIRPDDEKEIFRNSNHSLAITPADANRGKWKHVKKDGTIIHVEITAHNITFQGIPARLVMSKDITEKLQAEEQLIASEVRFRSIIEQFPYPVINYAPDGSCIGANKSWETMWQDKRDNVKGYNILEDKQMMRSVLAQYVSKAFQGETAVSEPYLYDPELIGQKGRKRWMVMTLFPLKNQVDELLEVILILQDVTERKEDEEKIVTLNAALSKSEKKFRGLIENSYDIVSLLDENLNTFYRSPSSERITGWNDEERKSPGSGIEKTHPDDIEKMKNIRYELLSTRAKSIPVIFRTLHKYGHYIWIEGVMTNMLHDEAINAVVCNFRDVTERKEAEEKIAKSEKIYKTIASGIPGSVITLIDSDFRYFLIEGDLIEKLGYSKEKLMGNKIHDVVSAERLEEFLPNFKRVMEGEIFTVELSRNGYDLLTRFVPLKNEDGSVYAAMTVAIDITELKKAERHIAELNVDLEQKVTERTMQLEVVNKELEAFTYSVSHDLRSPLRAVSGYSTMMKEDYGTKLDTEGNRILDAIVANSKRMGQLIDDLLNFSRLGRKEVSYHSINMTEMAESCKSDLLTNSDTGKYDLHISTLPDADGDHTMIRQVWMNLLSNAIKYSHKKNNPVIEIGYINDAVMNTYFVRDNGAGFDMHYVHKLFGVFQRLHSNEEFEGTGVGLALTERIIHKHKGKIWAEASINNGATFYFSLPKMT